MVHVSVLLSMYWRPRRHHSPWGTTLEQTAAHGAPPSKKPQGGTTFEETTAHGAAPSKKPQPMGQHPRRHHREAPPSKKPQGGTTFEETTAIGGVAPDHDRPLQHQLQLFRVGGAPGLPAKLCHTHRIPSKIHYLGWEGRRDEVTLRVDR